MRTNAMAYARAAHPAHWLSSRWINLTHVAVAACMVQYLSSNGLLLQRPQPFLGRDCLSLNQVPHVLHKKGCVPTKCRQDPCPPSEVPPSAPPRRAALAHQHAVPEAVVYKGIFIHALGVCCKGMQESPRRSGPTCGAGRMPLGGAGSGDPVSDVAPCLQW